MTQHNLAVDIKLLLIEVEKKVKAFLFRHWITILDDEAIHVVLMSPLENVSVQRSLKFSVYGDVEVKVHCKLIDCEKFMTNTDPHVPVEESTVHSFVDRIVTVVNNVRVLEVCSGYDDINFKSAWSSCPFGEIDSNPYQECRYLETFRSFGCSRLVNPRTWRCAECARLYGPLKRRVRSATVDEPHVQTGNTYLTEIQKLKKLEEQRKRLDSANRKIARLQARIQQLLQKEGVQVENSLSKDLSDILSDRNLTINQSVTSVQPMVLQHSQHKITTGHPNYYSSVANDMKF
jgi:hypothetical protein